MMQPEFETPHKNASVGLKTIVNDENINILNIKSATNKAILVPKLGDEVVFPLRILFEKTCPAANKVEATNFIFVEAEVWSFPEGHVLLKITLHVSTLTARVTIEEFGQIVVSKSSWVRPLNNVILVDSHLRNSTDENERRQYLEVIKLFGLSPRCSPFKQCIISNTDISKSNEKIKFSSVFKSKISAKGVANLCSGDQSQHAASAVFLSQRTALAEMKPPQLLTSDNVTWKQQPAVKVPSVSRDQSTSDQSTNRDRPAFSTASSATSAKSDIFFEKWSKLRVGESVYVKLQLLHDPAQIASMAESQRNFTLNSTVCGTICARKPRSISVRINAMACALTIKITQSTCVLSAAQFHHLSTQSPSLRVAHMSDAYLLGLKERDPAAYELMRRAFLGAGHCSPVDTLTAITITKRVRVTKDVQLADGATRLATESTVPSLPNFLETIQVTKAPLKVVTQSAALCAAPSTILSSHPAMSLPSNIFPVTASDVLPPMGCEVVLRLEGIYPPEQLLVLEASEFDFLVRTTLCGVVEALTLEWVHIRVAALDCTLRLSTAQCVDYICTKDHFDTQPRAPLTSGTTATHMTENFLRRLSRDCPLGLQEVVDILNRSGCVLKVSAGGVGGGAKRQRVEQQVCVNLFGSSPAQSEYISTTVPSLNTMQHSLTTTPPIRVLTAVPALTTNNLNKLYRRVGDASPSSVIHSQTTNMPTPSRGPMSGAVFPKYLAYFPYTVLDELELDEEEIEVVAGGKRRWRLDGFSIWIISVL